VPRLKSGAYGAIEDEVSAAAPRFSPYRPLPASRKKSDCPYGTTLGRSSISGSGEHLKYRRSSFGC
jgi:hypothetical protein